MPRCAHGAPPRRTLRCGLQRCRRARFACGALRRGISPRSACGARELPERGGDHPHRPRERRTGDPSRLRVPVGKRVIRRRVRSGGDRIHRSAALRDRGDGIEVGGQDADGGSRRAARSGLPRRRSITGGARARSGEDRLSGADQGDRWRRGQRNEDRRRRERFRRRTCVGAARSSGVVRR